MNTTILQENLLKAVTRAGRIISPKAQLPIMQNILLTTEETGLRITATNLEMTETVLARAKVEQQGGICVSSRLFTDFVMSLPQDSVHLVAKEGSLHVHTGGVSAVIPGVSPQEFPPVSVKKKKQRAKIDKSTFVSALAGVLFAAATDEGRPLLTGVRISNEEGKAVFVATDGYRLSMKKIESTALGGAELVVPARALTELVKTIQEEKEAGTIEMSDTEEGQLVFSIGETEIYTRPIVGEYPAIEKIIPRTHNTRALIDKATFLKAVKSASVFARDNANILRLHLDNQKIVVSANTPSVGENHVEVEARIDGEGGDIAFNSRFLTEFLNGFSEDTVMFEMTGSLNSGVFKPAKDPSYIHIIMPVRVAA